METWKTNLDETKKRYTSNPQLRAYMIQKRK